MKPSLSTIAPLLLVTAVAAGVLGGCAKEEPPPPVVAAPPPPPPAPPPAPPVRSIAELKEELRIDSRIEFAEEKAPRSTAERRAILEFFDAFARGDDKALSRMLDSRDKRELEAMVKSGEWERATKNIARIEIYQTGPSPNGDCVLALFEVDFDYQPQLWYYSRGGDTFAFKAAPTPPGIMGRLHGVDWIAAWHAILLEEFEIAQRPDAAIVVPQRILEEATDGFGAPGGAPAPATPGGPTPAPGTPIGEG